MGAGQARREASAHLGRCRPKFLEETSYKRTHEWDKSMLRWFHPYLGGKDLVDINRAVLDQVKAIRAKGSSTATVNRYMALVRTILRKACSAWAVGKHSPWLSGMLTLRRKVCNLRQVGSIP